MWPYTIEANGTSGDPVAPPPARREPESAHSPTIGLSSGGQRHNCEHDIDLLALARPRSYVGRGVKVFTETYWSGQGRSRPWSRAAWWVQ